MNDIRTETVGLQVIANGIIQAIHHYILAFQLEKKCERKEAAVDAIALLDRIRNSMIEEEINESEGPSPVSEESSQG
jgi:hypothetical protein